jgi:hypothetical protein
VWPIFTFVPLNSAFAIQVSERIAAGADGNWALDYGTQRSKYRIDELIRLVGAITTVPFV